VRDRERLEAILEIVKDAFPNAEIAARGGCGGDGYGKVPPPPNAVACSVPALALYVIFTDCLVINNGACPTWRFCNDNLVPR
jgi:hypothetical protein